MKRLLPLLLVLSGCATAPVTSAPSTASEMTTTTTTVTTTSPRIDTPRKLIADPCLMLTAADFDSPLTGTPQPYPDMARSCAFREGTGAETDLVVVVVFGDAYVRPENSMEMLVGDGHSAASSCGTGSGVVECTTLVAVNATESFKVIANLRNGNVDQVASIAQGKAQRAFKRLVTT
ncbi:hypothetical protein [Lentzea kentuckyensis]|uniref:hypothetical protein n=1 Tax=Lentzea kentuckyensis TaxID=360086 RepID=UPI000A3B92E3|nr:hypothetical protein [Lentzea kentuckyensis]